MDNFSRRSFLKTAVMAGGLAAISANRASAETTSTQSTSTSPTLAGAHAGGSDIIKVALIGAGGRGTGAVMDCIKSSPGVHIVAIGDAFMDRAEECLAKIQKELPDNCKVTKETLFDGFDNFEKVLKTNCDMVILATPPGFRPQHLKAAIEAGKHVFTEKPVAVDPEGIRSVIETSKLAKEKNLAIVAGTQRRHSRPYMATMDRIHNGAIGDVVGGQCYWIMGGLWVKEKKPEWSEMEWQMRNWLYFDWLSGDHIVEQHVHNIDVINWAMGGPPVKCLASGGRQVRTDPKYGNIYDHFSTEFEYANGARVLSMCRQWEGGTSRIGERLVGTKGTSDPNGTIEGANAWKYDKVEEGRQAYIDEHTDLIASIRAGTPLNEGQRVAESVLTAIMARMSAYTGQSVSFKWAMNASKLDLTPKKYEFGPNEINPVPMPGITKLV